jgi:hypothetical protein
MIWWRVYPSGFSVRILGWGFFAEDHRVYPPVFSESELGVTGEPWIHVGSWHMGLLLPMWLRDHVLIRCRIRFRGLKPERDHHQPWGHEIGYFPTRRSRKITDKQKWWTLGR